MRATAGLRLLPTEKADNLLNEVFLALNLKYIIYKNVFNNYLGKSIVQK